MNTKPLVDIRDLSISFYTYAGEVKAVRSISYQLAQGEVLGIVGESGSGKSVSSYSLLGIIPHPGRINSGHVYFEGSDLAGYSEKEFMQIRGKEISMIFQDPMTCLNPVYTVGNQIYETMRRHTKLSRAEQQAKAIELFELVGINQAEKRLRQFPHELSGGMRQRAMIAMALSCNPKLLIADEPTTALDVTIQAQIIELLKELKDKTGMSIIFVTHDLGVVSEICDRICVMYGGMIVESGTSDQIFYEARHPYTWGLLASIPRITEEHKRLVPIEGTPIDLINPPAGCPFAPRCQYCMNCCLEKMPPRCKTDETHSFSCWLPIVRAMKEEERA